MRTIEVDFDVHKRIEMERRGFDEPPNVALRRLIGLPEAHPQSTIQSASAGSGWSGDGVELPNGTRTRMAYNRIAHHGVIEGNEWSVGGQRFASPSGAMAVARTRRGRQTRLDGWKYWEVLLPGSEEWVPLDSLRAKAAASEKYANDFGDRIHARVSRRSPDPVMVRALALARDAVKRSIKKQGENVGGVGARMITERAKMAIAANPKFRLEAFAQLEREASLRDDEGLDSPPTSESAGA